MYVISYFVAFDLSSSHTNTCFCCFMTSRSYLCVRFPVLPPWLRSYDNRRQPIPYLTSILIFFKAILFFSAHSYHFIRIWVIPMSRLDVNSLKFLFTTGNKTKISTWINELDKLFLSLVNFLSFVLFFIGFLNWPGLRSWLHPECLQFSLWNTLFFWETLAELDNIESRLLCLWNNKCASFGVLTSTERTHNRQNIWWVIDYFSRRFLETTWRLCALWRVLCFTRLLLLNIILQFSVEGTFSLLIPSTDNRLDIFICILRQSIIFGIFLLEIFSDISGFSHKSCLVLRGHFGLGNVLFEIIFGHKILELW